MGGTVSLAELVQKFVELGLWFKHIRVLEGERELTERILREEQTAQLEGCRHLIYIAVPSQLGAAHNRGNRECLSNCVCLFLPIRANHL